MGRTLRLAICDDHPVFRAGLVGLLRDEGIDVVVEAGTAAQLLAAIGDAAPDLVVLDVELPDRNGLELVPELSARGPVLLLSAFDDPELVQRALVGGARGFVRKDASPTTLLRSIRDAAAGRTVLAPEIAVRLADSLRTEPAQREFAALIRTLTARQREVLGLLAEGRSNKEIGGALFVSEGTIKNHVTQILRTLGVRDRTRLAILLARHGTAS